VNIQAKANNKTVLEFVFCFSVNRFILCSSSFLLYVLSSFLFHLYINIICLTNDVPFGIGCSIVMLIFVFY
jgi:hypothetical protein